MRVEHNRGLLAVDSGRLGAGGDEIRTTDRADPRPTCVFFQLQVSQTFLPPPSAPSLCLSAQLRQAEGNDGKLTLPNPFPQATEGLSQASRGNLQGLMWKDFLRHHALTHGPLPACLFSLHTFTIPSGSFPLTLLCPLTCLCGPLSPGTRALSKSPQKPASRAEARLPRWVWESGRGYHGVVFLAPSEGSALRFPQRPRASWAWLVCNVSRNWKLCSGLTTAAAPLHLLAQPDFPGLSLDYFQSVLRGARALVQPAGHGRGQDVGVPRRGRLCVRVPRLLPHQGRQLAGPASRLHRRPRLERGRVQRALRTGGGTRARLPGIPGPSPVRQAWGQSLLRAWLCARIERDRLLCSFSFILFTFPPHPVGFLKSHSEDIL